LLLILRICSSLSSVVYVHPSENEKREVVKLMQKAQNKKEAKAV